MPETIVSSWGSRPISTMAILKVLSICRLPQPGHQAGFWPRKFSSSDIVFAQLVKQLFQQVGPAIKLVDKLVEDEAGFRPHQPGELGGGVIFNTNRELRLPQNLEIIEFPCSREGINLTEVQHGDAVFLAQTVHSFFDDTIG